MRMIKLAYYQLNGKHDQGVLIVMCTFTETVQEFIQDLKT